MEHAFYVREYVTARCNARLAYDRLQSGAGDRNAAISARMFACADRTQWLALDAAKAFLDTRQDLNRAEIALLELPVWSE